MRLAIGAGWLALALAASACGVVKVDANGGGGDDDDDVTEDFVSGTRLKAKILDGGGGARTLLGWVDSSLAGGAGLPCSFFLLADGSRRCLPVGASIFYLDATCSTPVAIQDGCQTEGGLAIRLNESECDPERYVDAFAIGDVVTADRLFQVQNDGTCADLGPPGDTVQVRGLLAPITPEDYVGATFASEPRGARLSVDVRVAEDGSREVVRSYDNDQGYACSEYAPTPGGPLSCVPFEGLAYLIHEVQPRYEDAGCSVETAYRPRDNGWCNTPPFVIEYTAPTGDQCGYSLAIRAAGAQLDTVYGGELCEVLPLESEPSDYFHVGDPIPGTQFAPVTTATVGDDRVGLRVTTTPEGERLYTIDQGAFVDLTGGTEVPCQAQQFSDAMMRCMPEASAMHVIGSEPEYYSDAACTRRVHGFYEDVCSTLPGYVLDVFQPPAAGCGGYVADAAQIRPVLEDQLGVKDLVYAKTGKAAECALYAHDVTMSWRVLGSPIDPNTFPTLSVRVEP